MHKKSLTFFLSIVCAFFLVMFLTFSYFVFKKSSYIYEKGIVLEQTDSEHISSLLKNKNISDSVFISKFAIKALKFFGYQSKKGEYDLPSHISVINAIKIFASGKSIIHKFTIPEGFSVFQVVNKMNKNEFLSGKIEKIPEEGSLMPDTYIFQYPTTKQQIIDQAQNAMKNFLEKEWSKRSKNCIAKTPKEALILASIVEKETHLEREMIAGIYTKRLSINMRMQACPTVIYAITNGAPLGRHPTKSELKEKLPHNTYTNHGLPPTPICNPGRSSILAALHPTETDNLFFVLNETGSKHSFSKTYEEHKKNIAKIKAKLMPKKILAIDKTLTPP